MKKHRTVVSIPMIVGLVFSLLVITGCLEVSPEAETVMIKSAARMAGYKFAKQSPELAAIVVPQAQTLLAASNGADGEQFVNTLFPAAVNLLLSKLDDPLLAATVRDAASLVKIDAAVPIKQEQMRACIQGFLEGVAMQAPQKG
jgi:hypothetical protein